MLLLVTLSIFRFSFPFFSQKCLNRKFSSKILPALFFETNSVVVIAQKKQAGPLQTEMAVFPKEWHPVFFNSNYSLTVHTSIKNLTFPQKCNLLFNISNRSTVIDIIRVYSTYQFRFQFFNVYLTYFTYFTRIGSKQLLLTITTPQLFQAQVFLLAFSCGLQKVYIRYC